MNGNTICSSCRRAASQLRSRDPLRQLVPRAGFVSLAQGATNTTNDAPPSLPQRPRPGAKPAFGPAAVTTPSTPAAGASPASPAAPATSDISADTANSAINSTPHHPTSKAKAKVNAKRHKRPRGEPKSDLLEELFLDGINKSAPGSNAALAPKTAAPDLYPHVEKLLDLLSNPDANIDDLWTVFTKEICPRVLPKDAPTPYSLHFASKSLLRKLITAHRKKPIAQGVPSVSEVCRTYACMRLLAPHSAYPLLDTFFCRETCDELSTERKHDVAEDILEAWRAILTHQSYISRQPSECANNAIWILPQLNPVKVQRDMATNGIEKAFESLMPQSRHKPLQGMASRALITFAMLTHPRHNPPLPIIEDHPFLKGIANVITTSGVTPIQLMQYFKTLELPYMAALNIDWSTIIQSARLLAGLKTVNPEIIRTKPVQAARHMSRSEHHMFKALARAISVKDLETTTKLWSDVRDWQGNESLPLGAPKSPISRELGHQFIVAFTAMNKPLAVEVWNSLISWGLPPTIATWHAMLEGLKNARDVKSLHGLWKRMALMRMRPDVGCWTTFISALMYSGDLEGGVRAVVTMKNTWEEAARDYLREKKLRIPLRELGDMGDIVKPTTAVINAVMVALLRKNKIEVASRVLSMGGDLGLRPDSLTYNTILRSLVRKGDEAALKNLLTQMEAQGVKGDVVTFTTTLERSLSHVQDLPPSEVSQLIDSLFSEMKDSGIKPNETTCSAMINSILRRAPSLEYLAPAEHVVEKMEAMGLKPTAHIQTMFINFLFRQQAPDLDRIGLLVEKFTRQKLYRDHIFWDRVIEGYAGLLESDRALQAVRQCAREGFKPGYVALQMLVEALCKNEEVEMAREIVDDVGMERGGPLHEDVRGVDGQHDFWHSAERLGLIAQDLEARLDAKKAAAARSA